VTRLLKDAEAVAAEIPDGALITLPPDYASPPMAVTRALVRRGARNLRLVSVPQSGLQADVLIGAGCVAEIETAAITMGEFGAAPRFTAAVKAGAIRIKDATCPAIHAELQASEKGIPFMPLRGIVGSDLVKHRPDWRVIDNPMADGKDPIVLLPALRPDVGLIHAPMADRDGNVWVGRQRELVTMAHAAERTIVTVERLHDGDLLEDKTLAAGTLPGFYVDQVAVVERGAWPLPLPDYYAWDAGHLKEYVTLAATDEGFAQYLDKYVHERQAA
jgi:glutaconate CoA-transferase, subunit A